MDNEEFRHDDHKFEFTEKEFYDFMDNIVELIDYNIDIKQFGVGDCINNNYPTSAILLTF